MGGGDVCEKPKNVVFCYHRLFRYLPKFVGEVLYPTKIMVLQKSGNCHPVEMGGKATMKGWIPPNGTQHFGSKAAA